MSQAMSQERKVRVALWASYPFAYLYTFAVESRYQSIALMAFTLLFVLATEYIYRDRAEVKHSSAESTLWMGSMLVMALSKLLGRNRVWGELLFPFIHLFAIYYLMSRSGRMVEGKSGRYFLLDAVSGALVFPFKHFFLRAKELFAFLSSKLKLRRKAAFWGAIAAVFVSLVFFFLAAELLASADHTFERWFLSLSVWMESLSLGEVISRLIWSLPIGAFLFALIVGTAHETRESIEHRAGLIDGFLVQLRVVATRVWTLILFFFTAFYLLFFLVQASYLFSGFASRLPEGFTYAEYARRGFFELCAITALNFALLWLISRSSAEEVKERSLLKTAMTVLLLENLLFAGIAFSKLLLYISVYGFTMLRIQSAWLVVVLIAACLTWLYSLWSRKNALRFWIYFSGVTLALLSLY